MIASLITAAHCDYHNCDCHLSRAESYQPRGACWARQTTALITEGQGLARLLKVSL